MNVKFISEALNSLRPNSEWVVRGTVIEWLDTEQTQPTEEEIIRESARLEYQEEVNEYQRKRAEEYPAYADQFDQIFHDGLDAWTATIQAVKDKYPKETMDADELLTRQNQAWFDKQLADYTSAMERLAQYQVELGREEVVEQKPSGEKVFDPEYSVDPENENSFVGAYVDVLEDVVVVKAIPPIPEEQLTVEVSTYDDEGNVTGTETIENPLITKDKEERAAAQAIVDATPQEVIDAFNES
jgi:hypothetical protein